MKLNLEQNTPEWDAMRKKCIGASDWPIILGLSPYKTPWQLWGEKLGIRKTVYTSAMQYGHSIEDSVRARMNADMGTVFEPCVFQHDEIEWLIASLDGYSYELKTGLEIKSTNKDTFEGLQNGVIPDHWMVQIQAQMFCADIEKVILFAQYKDLVYITTIMFDCAFVQSNIEKISRFYESLMGGEPPEMNEKDFVIVDDSEFLELEKKYVEEKRKLDQLEAKVKLIKNAIVEFGDDGNFEGNLLQISRVAPKESIDWKSLCKSLSVSDEIINTFKKPSVGYYRISIKKDG